MDIRFVGPLGAFKGKKLFEKEILNCNTEDKKRNGSSLSVQLFLSIFYVRLLLNFRLK